MIYNYYLMNLYILRILYRLVNNLFTLLIWSMRLRNLLTFEKDDQIMDAYSKIGLQ